MTTKTFEELMSEINSMNIEEALENAEKCLAAFEVRDIIKQQQEIIDRQKAENKALQMDNKQLETDNFNANMNCEHLQAKYERLLKAKEQIEAEASQEIHSLHSEIKAQSNALLAYKEELERYQSGVYIKLAKAEAVKEFVEMLKEKATPHYFDNTHFAVKVEEIDNLVKEIAGGRK